LISQGVAQLGGVKQRRDGKNKVFIHTRLSRAYLALARLSCITFNCIVGLSVCVTPAGFSTVLYTND